MIRTRLGPLHLEIALEGAQQELGFLAVLDVRMAVIELQLPVGIGHQGFGIAQQRAVGLVFGVQRRAGNGRVKHELVELGVVADRVIDHFVDVLRRMLFQADDARTEHANPVRLQLANQGNGVGSGQLRVAGVLALQAEPHPVDSQADQLFHRVSPQDVDGAEDVQAPRLAVPLHQVQQPECPLLVEQEVLVHDEEAFGVQVGLQRAT